MALQLRLKPQRLLPIRPFSSSSTPTPPLSPLDSVTASASAAASGETEAPALGETEAPAAPPPPSSYSSYFSDIKERLRSPPTPLRRIPSNPPPPPLFPGSSKPSSPTSLDDIRKQLAEFRFKSDGGPSPPSSSYPAPPTLSFQELFKNSVRGGGGDGNAPVEKRDHLSLESIRESLRKSKGDGLQQPFPRSFNLKDFQKNLGPNRDANILGKVDPLPVSIFGKEMKKKEEGGDGEHKGLKTEFLKMYSYDELGEKLRQLRPEAAAKGGNEWFSLAELNERLAKLRELEEKGNESRMGGVSFKELRESLVKLKEADLNKKANMQRLSILTNLNGDVTPAFMLKPPQEQLLEKYFHPDHMSSEEKMKLELKKVRDEFKMSESDCGSSRVQVAQLTTKIKHLSSVLHKKDKHSRKGLQEMVQRRKKLLKYLRSTDWDSYCLVLSKLGLRDTPEYKTPDYKRKNKTLIQTKKNKGKRKKKASGKRKQALTA